MRAFAESTRTGSLAGAARALNVTPSAISHLLRELEATLDAPLDKDRLGRRLIAAFDAIDAAVADARHQSDDVRVSTLSSFLTLWLVPRLGAFQEAHRQTRLLFSTNIRPVDLSIEPFECAIRWGTGPWPDLEATLLFRDQPVVVSNPRLAAKKHIPRLAARTRPDDWPRIAAALGWPDIPPALTFETRALAVQAATAGMGAAVVDRNLVAGMLQAGMLAEIAPDPPIPTTQGHWFVARPDRLRKRPIRQFRDWLAAQAARPQTPPWQAPANSP